MVSKVLNVIIAIENKTINVDNIIGAIKSFFIKLRSKRISSVSSGLSSSFDEIRIDNMTGK